MKMPRTLLILAVTGLVLTMAAPSGHADTTKAQSKSEKAQKSGKSKGKATEASEAAAVAVDAAPVKLEATGNSIGVCGCGKVFLIHKNTQFVEHMGRRYACCSPECHEKAVADPAAASRAAVEQTARVMTHLSTTKPN